METVVANLQGKVERVMRGGVSYLIAPIAMIVPGVLPGSKGALYYPPSECARNASDWNHVPITVYHPTDPLTGAHLSASDPGVLSRQGIGFVEGSIYNGKLRGTGWFNENRTRQVDPRVYQALIREQPMELSTGLYTDNVPAPSGAKHNGRPYEYIARNYRPDHLAILPDQVGACSMADGCGVLVNMDNSSFADRQKIHDVSAKANLLSEKTQEALFALKPEKDNSAYQYVSKCHEEAQKAHEEAAEAAEPIDYSTAAKHRSQAAYHGHEAVEYAVKAGDKKANKYIAQNSTQPPPKPACPT